MTKVPMLRLAAPKKKRQPSDSEQLIIEINKEKDYFLIAVDEESYLEDDRSHLIKLGYKIVTALPHSVTVFQFKKDKWKRRKPELSKLISDHLYINHDYIVKILDIAIK